MLIKTRIYIMIKRMGFFTIFIIAGFFIFGSEVLGAGSCQLSIIDNNAVRITGSGFNDYASVEFVISKAGVAEGIQSVTVIVQQGGSIGSTATFNQIAGRYTARIHEPGILGALLCSKDFAWTGTQNIPDGSVNEGGLCLEQKDCASSLPPLQCTERYAGSSEYICKQPSNSDTSQYLQIGELCRPNPTLIKDTCDPGKGLSCKLVDISIDNSEYRCVKTSQDTGDSPVTIPFEATPLSIPQLIKEIIKFSVGVAGVVAFFLLAVGSYKFMLSSGDPKALQSAQETISSAIAGLVLIVLAVALFGIMSGILQIPNINFDGRGGVVTDTTNIPEQ